MNKNSKIFVAGGSGMVGSAIIRKLNASGYRNLVSNYHSRKPGDNLKAEKRASRFIKLDLRNQKSVGNFFRREKPEFVFLAAAKVGGILANNTYKAEFIYDNLIIAANIIHAAYRFQVKKLLNLGSSCIYPRRAPQPLKEEYLLSGELEPTNEPYAVAKIAAIKLCRYFNEQYGTNFLSAMPTNLYGTNDNFNLETSHVLPALLRKMYLAKLLEDHEEEKIRQNIRGFPLGFGMDSDADNLSFNDLKKMLKLYGISDKSVTIWGTGEVYREFLHVDDLADACVFLMERCDLMEIGELINIGTGKDMRLKDLAMIIKEIIGFGGKIRNDTSKPDGMQQKLLDVSKMTELGWKPKITLREGIRQTMNTITGL